MKSAFYKIPDICPSTNVFSNPLFFSICYVIGNIFTLALLRQRKYRILLFVFDPVYNLYFLKSQHIFFFVFSRAFSIHSQACEAGLSETQMQLQKLNPDDDDEGMKTKNILISANDYLNFSDAKTFSKNSSYAQTLSSEETVF